MIKFNLLKKSSGKVEKLIQQYDNDYPFSRGWGNGFVLLSQHHPLHGKHFNDLNDYINVHGGLTISELVNSYKCEKWGISNTYIGWWCVGFDTTHFADTIKDWPRDSVLLETEYLAQQFLKYKSHFVL